MITPADIENKEFSRVKRGYSEEEVDEYLDLIIVDMEKLIRENRQLKEELSKAASQVDKHMNTETSVYETLEAAKQLMNDIAASAERRAEILLKNAELEANLITKEAKDSIAQYTEEGNRLRIKVENLRERYKKMLESEMDRINFTANDLISEFENDFLPPAKEETAKQESVKIARPVSNQTTNQTTNVQGKDDLSKTVVISKITNEEV